ncbi:uncharacterized protein LOC128088483 isoform X2 [Tympanuchus pallidicinctus]|uniref:uncharacterized protein LOC128088483 isoform X2 n=1 Tax=Tympanuchus pallidicinctus TaxID=109042 RepID=UPI0022876892|nr:uncharacterized protein LOC128088483 isoform X2 [Tympanuchus pallidicinctus]
MHSRAMSISLLGELPHFSGKVTAAPLQLREPRPLYLGRGIPWPTARAYRSLREKEAPHVLEALLTCVCLITLVPAGRAGESTGEYPVYEPEGDAGDGTGAGDPGSALSSGTETLADGMGPERAEDEPERGRKSQGLPRLLKELLKEIEKAPRGIDQETEQDALQEGSHPTLPVSDSGTQAAPTAGTPGMNAGKSTEAAVHQSARKRYIAAVVMFPAAVLACGAVIWMCKTYLVCKREERAAEPAHPDTN